MTKIGFGLMQVIDGDQVTVSETDLVNDIHDMARRLNDYFCARSVEPDPIQQRLAMRMIPLIRPLLEGTADKYALVRP